VFVCEKMAEFELKRDAVIDTELRCPLAKLAKEGVD